MAHETVLLPEAVAALVHDQQGYYIDGTFGRGGHSRAILKELTKGGRLLAIDKDPEALLVADSIEDERFASCSGSFSGLQEFALNAGVAGAVAGVLLDLGVSSPQLDDAERGFSFMRDGPLDMRMDPDSGESAAQWLAAVSEAELARVLKVYGEERFAKRISRAIVEARALQEISRTAQLADIVSKAHPAWEKGRHPATKSFQAIRIHINAELDDLVVALDAALDVMSVGGRLVVISFHSLEDRIVKQFMRDKARGRKVPASIPIRDEDLGITMRLLGKAVKASDAEVARNPRARSAVMRVAQKVA